MGGRKLMGSCGLIGLVLGFLASWFLLQAFCCLFFPLFGFFLYTSCVFLGIMFFFVQYTAFINKKK